MCIHESLTRCDFHSSDPTTFNRLRARIAAPLLSRMLAKTALFGNVTVQLKLLNRKDKTGYNRSFTQSRVTSLS